MKTLNKNEMEKINGGATAQQHQQAWARYMAMIRAIQAAQRRNLNNIARRM